MIGLCWWRLPPAAVQAQRAELAKARALYNERQFDAAIEAATAARAVAGDCRCGGDCPGARPPRTLSRTSRSVGSELPRAARWRRPRLGARPARSGRVPACAGRVALSRGRLRRGGGDFRRAAWKRRRHDPELHDAHARLVGQRDRAAGGGAARAIRARRRSSGSATACTRSCRGIPASATASYWSVVALRGSGEADRAWDAAVAGWARARLMGERSAAFRADLNRSCSKASSPIACGRCRQDQRALAEAQLQSGMGAGQGKMEIGSWRLRHPTGTRWI